jgi:hypothetical protein
MRTWIAAIAAVVWAAGLAAGGEAVVSVRMAHTRFLQFEPVTAFVTIRNVSDDLIIFGATNDERSASLRFVVDKGPAAVVPTRREGNPAGKIRIMPDLSREVMVDLSFWYDLAAMGSHVLTAIVEYDGQRFMSAPVRFDVESGLPIGSLKQEFLDGEVPPRIFSLRYLPRERSERLFVRIDDEDGVVNYGSYELGPLIRVTKPTIGIERGGKVTIVHESSSDRFTHSVFRSDKSGVTFVDQKYLREDGAPYRGPSPSAENPTKAKTSD